MKKSILLAGVCMLNTACTMAPEGYQRSSAAKEYLLKELPKIFDMHIKTISICNLAEVPQTTIMFNDGVMYTYNFNIKEKTAQLYDYSTKSQRDLENSPNYGCLMRTGNGIVGYEEIGKYRFEFFGPSVSAYVLSSVVAHTSFGDYEKDQIKAGLVAVKEAINEHKKFVPVDNSWDAN